MTATRKLPVTMRVLTLTLLGLTGCNRPDTPEKPPGLRATLDGHSKVRRIAFSPDGKTLAVGSETQDIRVWDLETNTERFRLENTANAQALVFSPKGRTLATACAEPRIRFWDTASGREKTSYDGDIGNVMLLAFHPDGSTLASWSEQKFWKAQVLFWDTASGKQKDPLHLATGFTNSLGFSPDGRTLAVARMDPDGVDFWDLKTRTRRFVSMNASKTGFGNGWVGEVFFCRDGRRMAFYAEETVVRLWNLDKPKEESVFEVSGRAKYPNTALRLDGKLAAVGDANGILTLWDLETGKKAAVVQASRGHIPDAYFSPDGRTMVTHEILESSVKIWDVPILIGKGK